MKLKFLFSGPDFARLREIPDAQVPYRQEGVMPSFPVTAMAGLEHDVFTRDVSESRCTVLRDTH